jgi:hypothetical protein
MSGSALSQHFACYLCIPVIVLPMHATQAACTRTTRATLSPPRSTWPGTANTAR